MANTRSPSKHPDQHVGVDDDLREQLEAAAKRAVRSLSGEAAYQDPRSLESDEDAPSRIEVSARRGATSRKDSSGEGSDHTLSKGEEKDDRRMRNIAVRDSAGNVPFSIAPSLPPSTKIRGYE